MSLRKRLFHLSSTLALAAATIGIGVARAGTPAIAPQDLGATAAATTETVSIVLKLRHPEQLDAYIAATVDPKSPFYHRFLSVEQFRSRFAPSDWEIGQVTDHLRGLGIVINEIYSDHLVIKATGTAAQFNQAFTTTLHDYVDKKGRVFHRPEGDHGVPGHLRDIVLYVAGLNTQTSQFLPHNSTAQRSGDALGEAVPQVVLPIPGSTATGVPGSYTTGDVANFYGVNPLYAKGVTGSGRTIGIATLANFLPSDAYYYWSQIGLQVNPNRIQQVHVDGGGELSGAAGSGETTLDVQQSGGLAPDAKLVIYDAPNTEAGFIDVFYKAVSDNVVDTLSVSWGSPEIYNFLIPGVSTDTQAVLVAYHQAFAEAAVQGISTFAATGDSGAYDTNRSLPYPPGAHEGAEGEAEGGRQVREAAVEHGDVPRAGEVPHQGDLRQRVGAGAGDQAPALLHPGLGGTEHGVLIPGPGQGAGKVQARGGRSSHGQGRRGQVQGRWDRTGRGLQDGGEDQEHVRASAAGRPRGRQVPAG